MKLQELVQSLSNERIIEIMQELGVDNYIEKNDSIIFPTLCHNYHIDEASMKLYYYPKTKTFHCYTDCGCTFNIIELLKKRYELEGKEYSFYKDIVEKIGGTFQKKDTNGFYQVYERKEIKQKPKTSIDLKIYDNNVLNSYIFYPTIEWLEDGISEEMMKTYNIRYSISENKIIIPHYDINNNLVGIRGRALNEGDLILGKYMPIQIGEEIYSHPLGYNLYGLNVVKDNIKRFKTAIIAEAEKSCMQYGTMFGQENNIVVASCGSSISQYQIDLLLSQGVERIIVAFDKEGENWNQQELYYQKLNKICQKYRQYCNFGFVYDTKNLLKLKDSPFDRGKEVTEKLIRGVIWSK